MVSEPQTRFPRWVDAAITLAVLAGAAWAVNIVVVRWALDETSAPPLIAAAVGVTIGAAVSAAIALSTGQQSPALDDIGRFALVGAIAPGSSQGLFVASIGAIGPARTSVLVGTSPAWSVLLAIVLLDESWQLAIAAGTAMTIAGGALISWEPGLSGRRFGAVLALLTAFSFAVRDVVARQFSGETTLSAWWAGAVVLGAASLVLWLMAMIRSPRSLGSGIGAALPHFGLSGLMIGLALPTLLAALDRGRVGIVAPLSLAAQNLAVVALSTAVLGPSEGSRRILVALVMIVCGAALVSTA